MITIRPSTGYTRSGELIETGIDQILDGEQVIGYVGRSESAPIQLIVNGLSEYEIKTIQALCDARSFGAPVLREVQEPPEILLDEEEELEDE